MEDVKKAMIDLYSNGTSLVDIAKMLNMTARNVKRDLIRSGIYSEPVTLSEKYEEAKRRYLAGERLKEISSSMKISQSDLSKRLKLDGVSIRGKSSTTRIFSKEEADKIIGLYDSGKSLRTISSEIGIGREHLSFLLKQNGVIPARYTQKATYNEEVFSKIDTEHRAYWLGMLYADGYVAEVEHRVFLKLKESDREHVQSFADFCGKEVSVIEEKYKTPKGEIRKAYKAQVMSKAIKLDLISKGCIPRKTHKISFPSEDIVPTNLIRHFIRGYFDGDGCISMDLYQVKKRGKTNGDIVFDLAGTEDFLKGCAKALGLVIKIRKGKRTHSLRVKGNKKALKILDELYDGATVFLKRKHELYSDFKSRCMPSSQETD